MSTDLAMGTPVLASNVDRVEIINVTYKHLYSHGYIALGKRYFYSIQSYYKRITRRTCYVLSLAWPASNLHVCICTEETEHSYNNLNKVYGDCSPNRPFAG